MAVEGCKEAVDLAGEQELGGLGLIWWLDMEWALRFLLYKGFWPWEDCEKQKQKSLTISLVASSSIYGLRGLL